jgi:hypothetical protein
MLWCAVALLPEGLLIWSAAALLIAIPTSIGWLIAGRAKRDMGVLCGAVASHAMLLLPSVPYLHWP